MLERSIIVAAHPYDEILWFSSIKRSESASNLIPGHNVQVIVHCHKDNMPFRISPKKHIVFVDRLVRIQERHLKMPRTYQVWNGRTEVIFFVDKFPLKKYMSDYHTLKRELKTKLVALTNVFTHNTLGGNTEMPSMSRFTGSSRNYSKA